MEILIIFYKYMAAAVLKTYDTTENMYLKSERAYRGARDWRVCVTTALQFMANF